MYVCVCLFIYIYIYIIGRERDIETERDACWAWGQGSPFLPATFEEDMLCSRNAGSLMENAVEILPAVRPRPNSDNTWTVSLEQNYEGSVADDHQERPTSR